MNVSQAVDEEIAMIGPAAYYSGDKVNPYQRCAASDRRWKFGYNSYQSIE